MKQIQHPLTGEKRSVYARFDNFGKRIPPPLAALPPHLCPLGIGSVAMDPEEAKKMDPTMVDALRRQ